MGYLQSVFIFQFKQANLLITHIDMTDRGVYKCIATNLIGSGSEWTLKMSVRCKFLFLNYFVKIQVLLANLNLILFFLLLV